MIKSRLKRKFFLTIGLVIIFFLSLSSIYTFTHYKNQSIINAYEESGLIAKETESKIDLFFMNIVDIAEAFSYYDSVTKIDEKAIEDIFYHTAYTRSNYIRGVYLGTTSGVMMEWGVGEGFIDGIPDLPEDYDPRIRPWYLVAQDSPEIIITQPYVYASVEALGVTIAKKITNTDGNMIGVLGIDVTLNNIQDMIYNLGLPYNGKAILLNDDFQMIAGNFNDKMINSDSLNEFIYPTLYLKSRQSLYPYVEIDSIRYLQTIVKNPFTEWNLMVLIPYNRIMETSIKTFRLIIGAYFLMIILTLVTVSILTSRLLEPINLLVSSINDMTEDDWTMHDNHSKSKIIESCLSKEIFENHSNDEIGDLSKSFVAMSEIIIDYSQNMEKLVEQRTKELKQVYTKLELRDTILQKELDIAGSIQRGIMPANAVRWNGYSVMGFTMPMEKIGGDFFDFLNLNNNKFLVYSADVSGHGIPAALITTMLKISLASIAISCDKPEEILRELNSKLQVINSIEDSYLSNYLTIFLSIMDENGVFCYANGGHQMPIIYRPRENSFIELESGTGSIIGAFSEQVFKSCQNQTNIEVGDKVLYYTDGITEKENRNYEFLGESGLKAILKNGADLNLSGEELLQHIYVKFNEFSDGVPNRDDITLILLERNPSEH